MALNGSYATFKPIYPYDMKNFFISYTSEDRHWAEWIAWQLEDESYTTVLQAWDFIPGSNFILEMEKANKEAERTIAVLTPEYLEKVFPKVEWASAFARDPIGENRSLIPVKVKPFRLKKGMLAQVVHIDLVGLGENEASHKLISGIKKTRRKPEKPPKFPGISKPVSFPGRVEGSKKYIIRGFDCCKFVHTEISVKGWLDIDQFSNPYASLSDPTDPFDSENISSVYMFLWVPNTQYLRSSQIRPLTPSAAICTVHPDLVTKSFLNNLEKRIFEKIENPPRKLRNEEKELILIAMGKALANCFVVAVAIPDIILGIGKRKPELAYQAITNLFVLPLMMQHKRIGVEELHVRLARVGEKGSSFIQYIKSTLRACYPRKESCSVDFSVDMKDWYLLKRMARMLSWAVGSYYNSGNPHWISIFERAIKK